MDTQSFLTCYDVVSMMVDSATDKFGSAVHVNEDRRNTLEHFCSIVDKATLTLDGAHVNAGVDVDAKDVKIAIVCEPSDIGKMDDYLQELGEIAEDAVIRHADTDDGGDEKIWIEFVISGIWEETEK